MLGLQCITGAISARVLGDPLNSIGKQELFAGCLELIWAIPSLVVFFGSLVRHVESSISSSMVV